jgi:hypothetical protein
LVYGGILSGANESPPVVSNGTGNTTVIVNPPANTMRLAVVYSGLNGNTAAAHIHCCTATAGVATAGVATTTPTFAGFPLGANFGVYDSTFDMTQAGSFNAAYITANDGSPASAASAPFAGIAAGKAYLNIHSSTSGGGEIRVFLGPPPDVLLTNGFE